MLDERIIRPEIIQYNSKFKNILTIINSKDKNELNLNISKYLNDLKDYFVFIILKTDEYFDSNHYGASKFCVGMEKYGFKKDIEKCWKYKLFRALLAVNAIENNNAKCILTINFPRGRISQRKNLGVFLFSKNENLEGYYKLDDKILEGILKDLKEFIKNY